MRGALAALTLALAFVACQVTPPVVYPPPDADASPWPEPPPLPVGDAGECTFPNSLCGNACRNIASPVLDCLGNSTRGRCCSDWLCAEPPYAFGGDKKRDAKFNCIAGAATKASMRACGIACQ